MNINIKSKNLLLIIFSFSFLINKTKIQISTQKFMNEHQKYWVGEAYEISLNNTLKTKSEIIYIKSKNNFVNFNLTDSRLTMKSSGRECLTVFTKELKARNCFYIYKTPKINFIGDNPIKLETKDTRKLKINSHNYPKIYIKYRSSNPGMIKINNEGEITALRPGNAIISAIGLDNRSSTIKVISLANNGLIDINMLKNLEANKYDNLMIVAHPDDEILWGGANLFKDNYFVVCLTNGFNQIRANEFRKALNLTLNGGIILNYTDRQDRDICNWSEIKQGIIKDLSKIINYKNWKKIVTHGPEGTTGHIHHKLISYMVSDITKKSNKFNILYYFSKFYTRDRIPLNFGMINKKELELKKKAIEIYQSQIEGIYQYWYHFLPYENWVLATKLEKY